MLSTYQLSEIPMRRLVKYAYAFFPIFDHARSKSSIGRNSCCFCSSSHSHSRTSGLIERMDNFDERPLATISIDRSGLHNPTELCNESSMESEIVKHLKTIIKFQGGPISVADYMEEVLTNPKVGYYINRDVFGPEGDFITSPEVSQMFGELVGVWVMCLWEQMGQPQKVNLVEMGPGRGALMADLLNGISNFKSFTKSLHVHMIECSPTLKKLQHCKLKCVDMDGDICNEKTSRGWSEKLVDIAEDSRFRFVLSPHSTPATFYLLKRCKWATPKELENFQQIEICAKAMDLTHTIAKRISCDQGGALIIDYGKNGIVSDSLQAIRKHMFVEILNNPGSADLSAYVDFAAIKYSAEDASDDIAVYGPITQSQFLGSLGINLRVEVLLRNSTDEQAESLRTGYWQLVGDGEAPFWQGPAEQVPMGMGTRYFAMAIVNKKQGAPVPFL